MNILTPLPSTPINPPPSPHQAVKQPGSETTNPSWSARKEGEKTSELLRGRTLMSSQRCDTVARGAFTAEPAVQARLPPSCELVTVPQGPGEPHFSLETPFAVICTPFSLTTVKSARRHRAGAPAAATNTSPLPVGVRFCFFALFFFKRLKMFQLRHEKKLKEN